MHDSIAPVNGVVMVTLSMFVSVRVVRFQATDVVTTLT